MCMCMWIGHGSQGEVYAANWNETVVAVKTMNMKEMDPDEIQEFCLEAEIMT